jgi:hypothetical protein
MVGADAALPRRPRPRRAGAHAWGIRRFDLDLADVVFARRLRREPELRAAVDNWLAQADDAGSWVEWEQRKHERLLAA